MSRKQREEEREKVDAPRDVGNGRVSSWLVFERSNYFTGGLLVYIIKRDILRELQGNPRLSVFVFQEDRKLGTRLTSETSIRRLLGRLGP